MPNEARIARHIEKLRASLPRERGQRVLIGVGWRPRWNGGDRTTVYLAHVQCSCGHVSHVDANLWKRDRCALTCMSCASRASAPGRGMKVALRRQQTRGLTVALNKRQRWPDAPREQLSTAEQMAAEERRRALLLLPLEQDKHALLFLAAFPHGALLEQVAEFYGLTRERIRQIEAKAIKKLRAHCEARGLVFEEHDPDQRRLGAQGPGGGWNLSIDELPTMEHDSRRQAAA